MLIKFLLAMLLTLGLGTAMAYEEPLNDFKSDGCSMYPDNLESFNKDWVHCCFVHDIPYWMGGTDKERLLADIELRSCVTRETSEKHGKLMYNGVRVGGMPSTHLPWRWGYGYDDSDDYKAISKERARDIYKRYNSVYLEYLEFAQEMTDAQKAYVESHFYLIESELKKKADFQN